MNMRKATKCTFRLFWMGLLWIAQNGRFKYRIPCAWPGINMIFCLSLPYYNVCNWMACDQRRANKLTARTQTVGPQHIASSISIHKLLNRHGKLWLFHSFYVHRASKYGHRIYCCVHLCRALLFRHHIHRSLSRRRHKFQAGFEFSVIIEGSICVRCARIWHLCAFDWCTQHITDRWMLRDNPKRVWFIGI